MLRGRREADIKKIKEIFIFVTCYKDDEEMKFFSNVIYTTRTLSENFEFELERNLLYSYNNFC